MTSVHAGTATRGRLEAWLALAVVVNVIAFGATHLTHHPAVARAAAFDVAVTVPALYYWMVVRPGAQSALTLVPLCLLALLRSMYVAPGGAPYRPILGGIAEVAVIALLAVRVRRASRAAGADEDIVERLGRAALDVVRVPRLASILATEVAVVYYAFARRPKPHVPAGAQAFSVHKETGVVGWLACLAAVSVVEAGVMHLVIATRSAAGAWLLTALSLYGAIWLVAMARSFPLRPALVGGDFVAIRIGLMASVRAPLDRVAKVEAIAGGADEDWKLAPFAEPNVRVTFVGPVEGERIQGRKRGVTRVAFAVDDPHGFIDAVMASRRASEQA